MFIKLVHDRMVSLLGDTRQELDSQGPRYSKSSILFLGLNGAGKTTTCGQACCNRFKVRRTEKTPYW